MPRRVRLLLVLALAAVLRLANWVQIQDGPLPWLQRWSETDMSFYDRWARDVAAGDWLTNTRMRPYHSGHAAVARQAHELSGSPEPFAASVGERIWDSWLGERTFYQDPLYSYLLAIAYRVGGGRSEAAFFVQTLLGLVSVALIFRIAEKLFDPGVGFLAGLLAALYGPLAYYETLLLKPVLIVFTSLVALLAFLRACEAPERRARFLLAGLASGLAFLAQSSAILFLSAAVALVAWRERHAPRRLALAVTSSTLGFGLALVPVALRNAAVAAPPFVFNATGGWTFLNHNAEDYDPWLGDAVTHHAGEIMSRTEGRLLPTAIETVRTHAGLAGWLRVALGKLACFAHWYEMPNNASYDYFRMQAPALARLTVSFALVLPLAAFGLLAGGLRGTGRRLLALQFLSGLATIAIFYSLGRLRLPVAVALIPFAAFGLVRLGRLARARQWAPFAAGLAYAALLSAYVLRPLPAGVTRLRVADYGVPNEIALNLMRWRAAGDAAGALRLARRQLALEPEDLRDADPRTGETRLALASARVAGSFAPLHAAAAELLERAGRADEAREQRRRAAILSAIAAQFRRASEAGKLAP